MAEWGRALRCSLRLHLELLAGLLAVVVVANHIFCHQAVSFAVLGGHILMTVVGVVVMVMMVVFIHVLLALSLGALF